MIRRAGRSAAQAGEAGMRAKLTGRQRRFVAAYLNEARGNATRAAEIAGYCDPNGNSAKILRHPLVRAAVERAMAKSAMGAAETLARITAIARLDAGDFLSRDPITGQDRIDLEKAREAGILQYADSVAITDQGIRIKFPGKLEALGLLAKHHGLLVERISMEMRADDNSVRAEILERLRSVAEILPQADREILAGGRKSLPAPAARRPPHAGAGDRVGKD